VELEQRIKRRYFLIKNIEKIIQESIYYRNNNKFIDRSTKQIIGNVKNLENKKKIL